jgi:hypothetical protein
LAVAVTRSAASGQPLRGPFRSRKADHIQQSAREQLKSNLRYEREAGVCFAELRSAFPANGGWNHVTETT